jgi:hypothetical protein
MGQCEVCGNEYDKTFEVIAAGQHHVFDSFDRRPLLLLCSLRTREGADERAARPRAATVT